MSEMIITLNTSGTKLKCSQSHPSLLVALEENNLCVEYQCREGYCGACRTRLLKGEVCYASQPLALLQEGDILPCCCKAKGDIELEL